MIKKLFLFASLIVVLTSSACINNLTELLTNLVQVTKISGKMTLSDGSYSEVNVNIDGIYHKQISDGFFEISIFQLNTESIRALSEKEFYKVEFSSESYETTSVNVPTKYTSNAYDLGEITLQSSPSEFIHVQIKSSHFDTAPIAVIYANYYVEQTPDAGTDFGTDVEFIDSSLTVIDMTIEVRDTVSNYSSGSRLDHFRNKAIPKYIVVTIGAKNGRFGKEFISKPYRLFGNSITIDLDNEFESFYFEKPYVDPIIEEFYYSNPREGDYPIE